MPRTGHYLKPRAGHSSPGAVVSVVVTGRPVPTSYTTEHCTAFVFGHATTTCSRRDHGKWSKPQTLVHDTEAGFWTWLERWAFAGRKTHVIAPVASDALNLLLFWSRVTRLGAQFTAADPAGTKHVADTGLLPAFQFDSLVLRGVPDIVEYSFNQRTYLWVSGTQFFPVAEDQLAKLSGYSRETPETPGAKKGSGTWTDRERCELWHAAYRKLGMWWDGMDAGGMGRTIGQCAKHFLYSRMPAKTVCTHNDPRALRLERLACHGGRASTWYYGDVRHPDHKPGPDDQPPPSPSPWKISDSLVSLDVCSMYPHIMATERLPMRVGPIRDDLTPALLADLVGPYCVVAHCDLETDVPEYPHRVGEYVTYPVGRFSSTLCGPELASALQLGHVRKVHLAVQYIAGTPFAAAARALLDMRAEAVSSGDTAWESFVKLLSNSLTGKLAQRTGSWVERPKEYAEHVWGEWIRARPGEVRGRKFRAIAGLVQEWCDDGLGKGTLQACYAHITSHGRFRMRGLRAAIGARGVVSQDTDGLWVLRSRLDSLSPGLPYSASRVPGALRLDLSTTAARFLSPKHYYAGGQWTLSGLHKPSIVASGHAVRDSYTANSIRRSPSAPPVSIDLYTRDVTLALIPHDGIIDGEGWQEPSRLPLSPKQLRDLLARQPSPSPSLFPPEPGVE